MRQVTLKVAPGRSEEFAAVGDYIRIKSAGVPVRVEVNSGEVDATIEEGDALNLKRFDSVRISHGDAGEQVVSLMIGNGTSADSSKIGGSLAVKSLPSPAVPFAQWSTAVGVASALLVPASPGRRFLMIQNNDAAANVHLNLAGAAAVMGGIRLAPGASLMLDVATPSGAIYAIADVATAANAVAICEG